MIKGGYKIVNFNGATLSGSEVTLAGIYDQIVDDYDKPIMVSGVTLSGELQDDAYASVKVNDSSVTLTVYGGIITVTEDDEVTYVVSKTTAELTSEIGDLDDLTTTDKDSAVDAINEVNGKVGALSELETTDKDSAVDAINELKGATETLQAKWKIKDIETSEISYTANTEKSDSIDLTSYCDVGYKAVGILGFNTGVQSATVRRMIIVSNSLYFSVTSPTSLNAGMNITILEEKI